MIYGSSRGCGSAMETVSGPFGVPPNPNLCAPSAPGYPAAPRLQTSAWVPATQADDRMHRLQRILDQFEVSIADANDLVVLEDYEIMVIADDSGSMQLPAVPGHMRVLGGPRPPSRWDELRSTLSLIIDLGSCFDADGLDLYFLNRPTITNVQSSQDPRFVRSFSQAPSGGTPLTERLLEVAHEVRSEKPVLLFILTDGEPSGRGGKDEFTRQVHNLVKGKLGHCTFRVQIMVCTPQDDDIEYLNILDRQLAEVDVTDDYYTELKEVQHTGRASKFSRGDWAMKAMLGPVSRKFDLWDEGGALGPSDFGVATTVRAARRMRQGECDACALQ